MRAVTIASFLVLLPSASISENTQFNCDFGFAGFGGGMALTVDRNDSTIGFTTKAGEDFSIPIMNTLGDVVIAFWVTPDMRQISTLSLNTQSGDIAITRVGTKEPLFKTGWCDGKKK
ncbi:hypothetical protein [Ruegeria arenilitoris]|uniref:hypothetical protein n=1 Tax=Ruegeria arenilitoris TaxID=1173585 RepID=UPI00147B4F9C|nr:hypothetical protein [Ruegeria arenilitoris]